MKKFLDSKNKLRVVWLATLVFIGIYLSGKLEINFQINRVNDIIELTWNGIFFAVFIYLIYYWYQFSVNDLSADGDVCATGYRWRISKRVLYLTFLPVECSWGYYKDIYASIIGTVSVWLVIPQILNIIAWSFPDAGEYLVLIQLLGLIFFGVFLFLIFFSLYNHNLANKWANEQWEEESLRKKIITEKSQLEKDLTSAESEIKRLKAELEELIEKKEMILKTNQSHLKLIKKSREILSFIIAGLKNSKPDKEKKNMKIILIDLHMDLFKTDDRSRRASLHKGEENFLNFKKNEKEKK